MCLKGVKKILHSIINMNAERQLCLLDQISTYQDVNKILQDWLPKNYRLSSPLTQRRIGPGMLFPSNGDEFHQSFDGDISRYTPRSLDVHRMWNV